uniref:Tetraspanin n=1 Tax=Megaselia scalaris TaxID=36166 RepID=T1GKG1_MEGSC
MAKYKEDPTIGSLWDYTQREFSCCGTNSYKDWKLGSIDLNNYTVSKVPMTCCDMPQQQIGVFYCVALNGDEHLNGDGCLSEFSNYISQHAVSLGAAGVVIAVIQFFGVLFACYIAREIKIRDGISGFM